MSRSRVAAARRGARWPLALVVGRELVPKRTAHARCRASCSSRSTRCAPTAWAPRAVRRASRRPSTRLAARGLVFEEALRLGAAHAALALDDAHAGSSRRATACTTTAATCCRPSLETLATRLKAAGYETGAFVGAYVLDRRFGLARGFDLYDDQHRRATRAARASSSRSAGGEDVVAAAAGWLGRGRGPFFAWVHLYDAHAPYDPPAPFREAHRGRGPTTARWPTSTPASAVCSRRSGRRARARDAASRSSPWSATTASRWASTAS